MTVEELLMPRYKVIADYPHNPYKVGDLLEEFTKTAFKLTVTYNGNSMDETQANTYPASAIEKMPHLFRKLNWWEERKVEDMPEYVKLVIKGKTQYVHKVEKWIGENSVGQPLYEYFNAVNYLSTACVSELEPATEQEYNTFINSKPTPNAKP